MARIAWNACRFLGLILVGLCLATGRTYAQDPEIDEYADPKVQWTFVSNITACPAGDSVIAGHHRQITIHVFYSAGLTRAVPPDSIWVVAWAQSGTARPYDYSKPSGSDSAKVFADDSTSSFGRTTVTVTGLSGCGTIGLNLYVSGELKREGSIIVRSVDTNGDGVVTSADESSPCDVNYSVFGSDADIVAAHLDHSHRQALHGTVVRRTNACATCIAYGTGTLGGTELGWSPDSRWLSYTVFLGTEPYQYCAIHFVPSDPVDGNTPVQISYPPEYQHDYDPQWTPLGDEIFFDRDEHAIYRQVPVPDGQLTLITSSGSGQFPHGDVYPAVSPDGKWTAFCRKSANGLLLYKIPIEGVTAGAVATQLTSITVGDDEYPQWAADGQWIYFQRWGGGTYRSPKMIMRIHPDGTGLDTVLAQEGKTAVFPGMSPDGVVLAVGAGDTTTVVTRALMVSAGKQTSFAKALQNFPDYVSTSVSESDTFRLAPLLSPRFSPDGTRLTLRAAVPGFPNERPQVWATRRNMSLPPTIASVGSHTFSDTIPVVDLSVLETETLSQTLSASDPESDAITFKVYSVATGLGYTMGSSSGVFAWTPDRAKGGYTYNVRLQAETPSGGCDYAIARIAVTDNTLPRQVTDLDADVLSDTEMWPIWTAPGEDGAYGQCVEYDMRYSTSTITSNNFAAASQVTGEPAPAAVETPQGSFGISSLSPSTQYWFALKAKDAAGNWSVMSNVLHITTMSSGGGGMRAHRSGGGMLAGVRDMAAPTFVRPEMSDPERSALVAEMQMDEGFPIWSIHYMDSTQVRMLDQPDSVGILLQLGSASGGWTTRRQITPGEGSSRFALRAQRWPGRVVFLGDYSLVQAWSGVESGSNVLDISSAEHSRLGNVTAVVESAGRYESGLSSGDTLTLRYGSSADTTVSQEWFVLVASDGSVTGEASLRRPRLGEQVSLPFAFALRQNRPNPFSGSTAIHFELPIATQVRLEIFDAQGRLVRTVTDGAYPAGFHVLEWDRRTNHGQALRAGVYLYRIQAGAFRDQKKMVLLGG